MRAKYLLIFFALIMCSCERTRPNSSKGQKTALVNTETIENQIELVKQPEIDRNQIEDVTRNSVIIQMIKRGGVYEVPIEINGRSMNFIFDTGASDITISNVEAMFLYKQGQLTEEDIVGTQEYMIADGTISEGTIINLRKVKIGNKELLNVKASIVHNSQAPLLLGQSALSRFGKVSIDYDNSQIILE